MRSVRSARAPSTVQAKALWPWASSHGWKWSEMTENSKPARSAAAASATSDRGSRCSHIKV